MSGTTFPIESVAVRAPFAFGKVAKKLSKVWFSLRTMKTWSIGFGAEVERVVTAPVEGVEGACVDGAWVVWLVAGATEREPPP